MGWSFRKSIRLGKGLRINLSRRGIGWSIGSKLLRFGVSGGRSRVSSGVGPFRYQKTLPNEPAGGGCGCLSLIVVVLAVGVVVGALQSGSRSSRSETKANAPRSTPGAAASANDESPIHPAVCDHEHRAANPAARGFGASAADGFGGGSCEATCDCPLPAARGRRVSVESGIRGKSSSLSARATGSL